jgi:hypothetical protein
VRCLGHPVPRKIPFRLAPGASVWFFAFRFPCLRAPFEAAPARLHVSGQKPARKMPRIIQAGDFDMIGKTQRDKKRASAPAQGELLRNYAAELPKGRDAGGPAENAL